MTTIAAALLAATETLHPTSATPRLDAELLLAHVLGWPRARLLAEGRTAVSDAALAQFCTLVERRAALEPVAYLVGHREFFGLDFVVDRRVLVPRPETELLVELALMRVGGKGRRGEREKLGTPPAPLASSPLLPLSSSGWYGTVADIGTGSGCIAVALAVNLPGARVYAVDISTAALDVARENVARHGVAERVTLLEGDLLDPVPESVDLLVSNPPYTLLEEIDDNVRRHEPHLALDGGPDGLRFYQRLLREAPRVLRPGGTVLLEIGAWQGAAVIALTHVAFPGSYVSLHRDLAGHDRVVCAITAART